MHASVIFRDNTTANIVDAIVSSWGKSIEYLLSDGSKSECGQCSGGKV